MLNAVSLDFNEDIRNGEKFTALDIVRKNWEKYIGTSFEPQGTPQEDNGADIGKDAAVQPQTKSRKKKDNPVKAVTREDGLIWIDDTTGLSREELQARVRGFLTAHYHEYQLGL